MIPKIVHFVYLGEKLEEFTLAKYLAISSAFRVLKPDKIYYHYRHLPRGYWWDLSQPFLELRQWPDEKIPTCWGKKPIKKIANVADAIRIKILYEEGGIYLDMDTISVRSVDDILKNSVVLGRESNDAICNAIMMCIPGHPFFKTWIENYEDHFVPDGWGEAACIYPMTLYQSQFKDDPSIYLADEKVFFWPCYYETEKIFEGSTPIDPSLRILHLWYTCSQKYLNKLTISDLLSGKSMYAQIIRMNNLLSYADIFNQVYLGKQWGTSSVRKFYDGPGSDFEVNLLYISCIQRFLIEKKIETYLDLGCGTGRLSNAILEGFPQISYTGIDICSALIEENKSVYPDRTFLCLDARKDNLPKADLVVVRQILQHLSREDVLAVIKNISTQKYKYVIFADSVSSSPGNLTNVPRPTSDLIYQDYGGTGIWYESSPFSLPILELERYQVAGRREEIRVCQIFLGQSDHFPLKQMLEILSPHSYPGLKRFGGSFDGGYLLPMGLLHEIDHVLTFGVGSEVEFEKQLAGEKELYFEFYDGTVETLPTFVPLAKFTRKNLGVKNGSNQVRLASILQPRTLLKIDIEGAEWETLLDPEIPWNRVVCLLIEFHKLGDREKQIKYLQTLQILNQHFLCVSVHGNNWGNLITQIMGDSEYVFPDYLEVTFVNRQFLEEGKDLPLWKHSAPSLLDRPCKEGIPELHFNYWSYTPFSFHFLLATIGRPSLQRMVESLLPQLRKRDYLTIVFDGPESIKSYDLIWYQKLTNRTSATLSLIVEGKNLGFWGHGIRNKHCLLPGDFVLHCDDDDVYLPQSLDVIRENCVDLETVYVFKMRMENGEIIPRNTDLCLGNIGTPNGVIPAKLNAACKWGLRHGGDWDFYSDLFSQANDTLMINEVIYQVRPK